jgi:hypothetical protein
MPSRKWFATQITAVAAWVVALIQNDLVVDSTLAIAAVGIVSQALIGYVLKNTQADKDRQVVASTNG